MNAEGDVPSAGPSALATTVTLVKNLNHKDARFVALRSSSSVCATTGALPVASNSPQATGFYADAVRVAANKFRLRKGAVRLFDASGTELTGGDGEEAGSHGPSPFAPGAVILVSAGEDWIGGGPGKAPVQAAGAGNGKESGPAQAAAAAADVILVARETPVEAQALQQLRAAAELPGVFLAVGLPDLHSGPSCPVGAAIAARGFIHPALVGSDIGCGILLARTTLAGAAAGRPRTLERWAAALDLEGPWEGDAAALLRDAGLAALAEGTAPWLGTIGRGNHFAELQAVDSIEDEAAAAALGLDFSRLYLCAHSGSRGLGENVLNDHVRDFGHGGAREGSHAAGEYLRQHELACRWAAVNRALIARRFLGQLQADVAAVVLDVCHNHVVPAPAGAPPAAQDEEAPGVTSWLHRKGAAPADRGPVLIPGSRGALSYLVLPTPPAGPPPRRHPGGSGGGPADNAELATPPANDGLLFSSDDSRAAGDEGGDEEGPPVPLGGRAARQLAPGPGYCSGWSLAHGAGRRMARSAAVAAGRARHLSAAELRSTALGGLVVCDDKSLLYEEAPDAYKSVESVIADLLACGLCTVVAVMRPVLTYKVRAAPWAAAAPAR